jgi:hypothetical protein
MTTLHMICTDTLVRENDRWRWFADHGGVVEAD